MMRPSLLLMAALALAACRTKDVGLIDSNLPDEGLIDEDGDGVPASEDCDDSDAEVSPEAEERCDGVDNDCDGETDEEPVDGALYYSDGDGDGYGAGETVLACEAPEGFVEADGDCEDGDAAFYPGAPEDDCSDPNDYNCDGSVGYADGDGDGVPACEDCDDSDASALPGGEELCDEVDQDCDGAVDEGVTTTFFQDIDGDGYGDLDFPAEACEPPEGYAASSEDCDDADAAVNPGAAEVCNDVDDDCDGLLDDADDSLDASSAATWYTDADADGYGDPASGLLSCEPPSGRVSDASDCDDADGAVNPAASEVCDGLDNDCDGDIDDADGSLDASTAATWYTDSDGDGYGDAASSLLSCDAPSGAVSDAGDCDDGDAAVNPSASEVCNSLDDDCDGLVDDADGSLDASTGSVFYTDSDGDGYGDAASSLAACLQPSGAVSDATDCDDSVSTVYPGAAETCSGMDDDCDGTVDDPADLLGSDPACGAVNCNDVLATRASAPDGEYWLDFNSSPLEVYCDMSTSGGGWTVIHPDDIGGLGSLDAMRDELDVAMTYLRDTSGNRYYTELTQLAAYSSYDVDVSDYDTTRMRVTFIPRSVASQAGATQGMNSNGQDLTFTNCDGNGNSYIEFWTTGQSYVWNADYTMSYYWRDSKLASAVTVPDDYFTFTAIHFGGCGTHSTSPYWSAYDGMQDAAIAVR